MNSLAIAAVGWSITAVGWLISPLVNNAVTALLEDWAKRKGLREEFETLKKELLKLYVLLESARRRRTNNSFLDEWVHDLQQLVYRAADLFAELDYYRLEDENHKRGTEENVNCSNEGMSCCSSTDNFRSNMSPRMIELTEQILKCQVFIEVSFNNSTTRLVSVDPSKRTSPNLEKKSSQMPPQGDNKKRDRATFEAALPVDSSMDKKPTLVASNSCLDASSKAFNESSQKNLDMSQELTNLKDENKS